jgi:hypothetical protein
MAERPALPSIRRTWLSLDTWAVLAATAFILLIVAGVLPRVPW